MVLAGWKFKMIIMKKYNTVSETLNKLKAEGYELDFNLAMDCVECKARKLKLYPSEFVIDSYYRFEGASVPEDNAIIYAISSKDGLKGTILDAYGIYADSITSEMLERLKIDREMP